jgi:DNA-binding NtrC family response regulator
MKDEARNPFEPRLEHESTLELEWPDAVGPWTLEVGSPHGTTIWPLASGERRVLGSGASADIRIRDRAVSAGHARVEAGPAGVTIEDLGSKNGVFVGHARVGSVLLSSGVGSFVLGRTTVMVRPRIDEDEIGAVESLPGVIGNSAAMRRVAREVRRHAGRKVSVLLHGESGTGKDVVARAIHELSGRAGAYVPMNVGAITESLADTELFGHRRGAFTGAVGNRAGAFEQANRGTLFLDEIAELPLSLQVKLLRVVEDGMVRAIGAAQPAKVDVRLIAASWAELDDRVAIGRFREDLYHRIARVVIELPPLRQRKSDIPALASALLVRMAPEVGMKKLSSAALARLVSHPWQGNVRELENVLYRAAARAHDSIAPEHVERALPRVQTVPRAFEPRDIESLLDEHGGNIAAAARAACVPRSTFRTWLNRLRRE